MPFCSPTNNESSCRKSSLSQFGGVSVLDFSCPYKCIVVSHFNLQFRNDMMLGNFLYVRILLSLVRCLLDLLPSFLVWWFSY